VRLRPADWGMALPAIVLLVLAVAFAGLGRWQLARAAENRDLTARFQSLEAPAPSRAALPPALSEARYRRVALRGRYLATRHVLLDSMIHEGRAGFQVLTPFRAEDGQTVLVNRGWFDPGPGRDRIPALDPENGAASVLGWVDSLPRAAWRLPNAVPDSAAPYVVLSYPSLDELEAAVGQRLAGYQVLLDAAQVDGFVREWQPDESLAERNLAYAGQWFVFALMALIGAGLVLYRRHKRVSRP